MKSLMRKFTKFFGRVWWLCYSLPVKTGRARHQKKLLTKINDEYFGKKYTPPRGPLSLVPPPDLLPAYHRAINSLEHRAKIARENGNKFAFAKEAMLLTERICRTGKV